MANRPFVIINRQASIKASCKLPLWSHCSRLPLLVIVHVCLFWPPAYCWSNSHYNIRITPTRLIVPCCLCLRNDMITLLTDIVLTERHHRTTTSQSIHAFNMQRKRTPPPSTSPTRNLPPRLTVPPLPPRIHRKLAVAATDDGLVIRPLVGSGEAVLVRWGLRGKVEAVDRSDLEGEVELGGIIGIVRLWDGEQLPDT